MGFSVANADIYKEGWLMADMQYSANILFLVCCFASAKKHKKQTRHLIAESAKVQPMTIIYQNIAGKLMTLMLAFRLLLMLSHC